MKNWNLLLFVAFCCLGIGTLDIRCDLGLDSDHGVSLVSPALAQIISYAPSTGGGVSYSVNIPSSTLELGSGPIFFQLQTPADLKWAALGLGDQMTGGQLFVIYSASDTNVTLSPRRANTHVAPTYDPHIRAFLLEGSGIYNGLLTANVRCDNCATLDNGKSILSNRSSWVWAVAHGPQLISSNISETIYQHDWHGIFTFDLTKAVGGDSLNPFFHSSPPLTLLTLNPEQQQISDTLLHKKRIAHGVMSSVAFVLLFPNFGLLLHIIPTRYTVAWIHAPLQMFAVLLALAGLILGVSVSKDLQELAGYHPVLGYLSIGGVVIIQPILGIMQHVRFRQSREKTLYGVSHRWLGRFLCAFGIVNGGIGFHYAQAKNPDIPLASPIVYAIICAFVGAIYVLVLLWSQQRACFGPRTSYRGRFLRSKEPGVIEWPMANGNNDEQATAQEVDIAKEKIFLA